MTLKNKWTGHGVSKQMILHFLLESRVRGLMKTSEISERFPQARIATVSSLLGRLERRDGYVYCERMNTKNTYWKINQLGMINLYIEYSQHGHPDNKEPPYGMDDLFCECGKLRGSHR